MKVIAMIKEIKMAYITRSRDNPVWVYVTQKRMAVRISTNRYLGDIFLYN